MSYPTQYPKQYQNAIPSTEAVQERDPREEGNLVAKLQVAEELVRSLRTRTCFLAERINSQGIISGQKEPQETHMSLLRFPDEIIADARAIESALNRIEGALGV